MTAWAGHRRDRTDALRAIEILLPHARVAGEALEAYAGSATVAPAAHALLHRQRSEDVTG